MPLTAGTKLGPYEISAPIGAGGMGEVYRARDTRLGRDVALKILPESFARDADHLRRFEQEARAVAALNHPNILAVFDIGKHDGAPFIVSELLEGENLRAVLDHGAIPQRKTIEYGVQIAHGLAAAHEKGIVHRDLKPENVFITRDGRIKILDFGLAKLAQKVDADPDEVTRTGSNTAIGVVMGTASYMAPEQVRGQAVDARTDIFAFGALLYEMLSGTRAFRRDTPAETMTAVLKEDPPELVDPTHSISSALERIVRRCVEKNPEQRFQSARDLSFALSALSGTESSGPARPPLAPGRSAPLLWISVALALAAIAAGAWWLARRPAATSRLQFTVPVPEEMSVSQLALSRDGSMLAFVSPDEDSGLPMLYVQRIGSPNVTLLPGTQGATYPFWSPDGTYVAFFANSRLQKILVAGGAPQVLANVLAARGGSWGSHDVIIYSPGPSSGIWRVNADGSGRAPVTYDLLIDDKNQDSHRWPVFLPDGEHFLFWAGNFGNPKDDQVSGIYAGSLTGKEKRLVVLGHSSFGYDSHRLYYADDSRQLISIEFNPSTAAVSGRTTAVANVVGIQPSTYWAAFAVAQNGTVIYNTNVGASLSALTWIDRAGKELGRLGDPAIIANPTLSPDNNRVAVDISDLKTNNVDVWLVNAKNAGLSRFTFDPEEDVSAIWSRDGSMVAYRTNTAGGVKVFVKRATGLEREKSVLQAGMTEDYSPSSWSPDGQTILCTDFSATDSHLELLAIASGIPTRYLSLKSNQSNGQISGDGKWVAYASDESGVWEIYVSSFPGAAGKWQVSHGGGTEPRWRADGKEIFYIGPGGTLMAVPVNGENGFATGTPVRLFEIHGRAPISATDLFSYDVSKDGQRFIVNRYVKPEHVPPLIILLQTTAAH
jgi:Tol biopolymer transport system component